MEGGCEVGVPVEGGGEGEDGFEGWEAGCLGRRGGVSGVLV